MKTSSVASVLPRLSLRTVEHNLKVESFGCYLTRKRSSISSAYLELLKAIDRLGSPIKLFSVVLKKVAKTKVMWVEELSTVLWSYRTTKRRGTDETIFLFVYGTKAVIPMKLALPTL